MGYVTPEQIAKAKEMDLLTYLQIFEPTELVKVSPNTYCTREHDSLKISNGKWCWHSRGIGGKNALKYLIEVKNIPFTEAVEMITGQAAVMPSVSRSTAVSPPKPKVLLLPKVNRSATAGFNYLRSRGIDAELIHHCIRTGRFYESYPHHSAVFVGLDKENKPRYATIRGIGNDFIGEANGMLIPEKAVTDGDLARIGFGQTIAVTPVQLAAATASVVNGGNYYTPHLLKEVFSSSGVKAQTVLPELKNKTFSEKTSRLMASYLEGVVSEGSGKHAYIEGYKVGGKTGTAQKYENGVIAQGKYVSSFVGFFPSDDPKYLVLVIVDEPVGQHYGSIVAAPYAKSIFEGIIGVKKIKPQN